MQILQEVDQYNSYMDQVVRESEIFNEAEEQVTRKHTAAGVQEEYGGHE
jgi:hypothetical protein